MLVAAWTASHLHSEVNVWPAFLACSCRLLLLSRGNGAEKGRFGVNEFPSALTFGVSILGHRLAFR